MVAELSRPLHTHTQPHTQRYPPAPPPLPPHQPPHALSPPPLPRCVHHTADKAKGIAGLLPETVCPAEGGGEKPLDQVVVGELLIVKSGTCMPVDGTVVSGSSSVDESMLTGESFPVLKHEGDSVCAGTTNQSGVLIVRADKVSSDCTASALSQLVSFAQTAGGNRELLLERFAKVYTLTVLVSSLLLALVPMLPPNACEWSQDDYEQHLSCVSRGPPAASQVGLTIEDAQHSQSLHGSALLNETAHEAMHMHRKFSADLCDWWLRRALALIVISCPCSLIVAMPVTYACGVSALARWGVLVKSTKQMELLARMRTLAIDKTGTLTEGRFRLQRMTLGAAAGSTERLMRLASGVQSLSSHPIAAAFLDFSQSLGVQSPPTSDFELLEGEGVTGVVDGVRVHVGNDLLARRIVGEYAARKEAAEAAEAARLAAAERAAAAAHSASPPRTPQLEPIGERQNSTEERGGVGGPRESSTTSPRSSPRAAGGGAPRENPSDVADATGASSHGQAAESQTGLAGPEHVHGPECLNGGCGRLKKRGLQLDSQTVARWRRTGSCVLWVILDGQVAGACELSDTIRGETVNAIRALNILEVNAIMLTGDCAETAEAIRLAAGLHEARAGMKPKEKLEAIKEMQRHSVVGMMGDGVNDGPALAIADVGVAMGPQGSAMASQASGVVLMTNDLRRLADAIYAARLCTRTMLFSVIGAISLKIVPLVVMFTVDNNKLPIVTAVGSDMAGMALVLLMAIRLMRIKPRFAISACASSNSSLTGPEVKGDLETKSTHSAGSQRSQFSVQRLDGANAQAAPTGASGNQRGRPQMSL